MKLRAWLGGGQRLGSVRPCSPMAARRVWRCHLPRPPCRHSSGSAAAVTLDVVPEGTLSVRIAAVDLAISTETESCDHISFEASGVAGLGLTSQGELAAELVGTAEAAGGGARPLLAGLIPAKYNVDIQSAGGDVKVGFLEGAATIDTAGGAIAVDKVTSAEIHLASGGGDLAARVLQGMVDINTLPLPGAEQPPGAVTIQRLVSPTVEIASGRVDVAAVYADSYHIHTHGSGAPVTLGSSHTKDASTITTEGSDISIGSQEGEGPMLVESRGGDVVIKLSRQMAEVRVVSGGGAITVKAASDLSMRLEVSRAGGGVHIDANHSFVPDEEGEEVIVTF